MTNMGAIYFVLILAACVWSAYATESLHPIRNYGIYGGKPIKITEAPFMAIVRPDNIIWHCGASIVAPQFLVTAAHCFRAMMQFRNSSETYKVTVGTDKISGGETYQVDKVFIHPKYKYLDYDIAVIKLKAKLVWSERVKPIEMANSLPKDGETVDTMGFGKTENGQASEVLLGVNLPSFNHAKCKKALESIHELSDQMICAGGQKGKDSCQGDSGGPLRYKGKLLGVVSWGNDCGLEGSPGVYASLPAMIDFVQGIINKHTKALQFRRRYF